MKKTAFTGRSSFAKKISMIGMALAAIISSIFVILSLGFYGGVRNAAKIDQTGQNRLNTDGRGAAGNVTPITLTIGDVVLYGFLNDSQPAQSFKSQLPMTVFLRDWGHDFCGGKFDVKYGPEDVQDGFKNGDLGFWTPGRNFMIFVSGEEDCADYKDNVILGRLEVSQETLDSLYGWFHVTIALR